jgi:predicted RNA-binding protein with PUA-like domain
MKQIKVDKLLAGMDLLRLSRLSVQTIKAEEWERIMELAGEK